MAIRSGRFRGDASGTGIKIIAAQDRVSAVYRIFNSGDMPDASNPSPPPVPTFDVNAGYTKVPTVSPGCSLDVLIEKSNDVTIIRTDHTEVVGFYDYLGGQGTFRSGRFTGDASGGIQIVQGDTKAEKMYRIFNSGKSPFSVTVDGSSTPTPLGPTFSLDVAVSASVVVTASGEVEGIYEYLNTESPVRSGRFNIKAAPATDHKIIDLKSSSPEAYYRIFNSGDKKFKVMENSPGGSPASLIGEIDSEQSFDFTIGSKRDITIVASSGYPIEGIYDLVSVNG